MQKPSHCLPPIILLDHTLLDMGNRALYCMVLWLLAAPLSAAELVLTHVLLQVTPESKERYFSAPTLEAYAERMWQMAVSSNPFSDPNRLQVLGNKQQPLHDEFIAAVVENAKESGRHDAAAERVASRYTVLQVRARVP